MKKSAGKTIVVVYTNIKLSQNEANCKKHYVFNTSDKIKVGDLIESKEYTTAMQVIKILDKTYTYYNLCTSELSDKYTSAAQREVRELILREDKSDAVYARILNKI